MSIFKLKGDAMHARMKAARDSLVKKYEAGGSISYDEATGLRGPAGATSVTLNGVTYALTKTVPFFDPDAQLGATAVETATVPNFDQIKLYNIARGVPSGSMMDALAKFASGKVLELSGNSVAIGLGGYVVGEVPCLMRITANIKSIHGTIVPKRNTGNNGVVWAGGGAAQTRDAVETTIMEYRGKFKIRNYRGTPEMLSHSTSIWATKDKSQQSMFLLGVNSLIRFYGADQVLDLNGFKIEHHERPNRFAAFSALVDLADGHFLGLSSKGAKNAHIFCSKGTGILGRNNHFAIRGHLVDGLLIENVISGAEGTINGGSYFGTVILNKSKNVVVKDVQQNMVNKAVALSSAGLSFYAQLVNQELLFGFFETATTWSSLLFGQPKSSFYPWLKWEDKLAGDPDTFGNGKKTPYPVLKTQAELESALGANSAQAARILSALEAAKAAYAKSMKSADDMYIQVHTASSQNHASINLAGAGPLSIPHTTNAVVLNPANSEGLRYPDSVGYGFRVGAAEEGVGPLANVQYADTVGLPKLERIVENIHVMDSSFKQMHLSPMEAISLGVLGKGLTKTFNGMALRPFGYQNALNNRVGSASSLVLMSNEAMDQVAPMLENSFVSTADEAVELAPSAGWTAAKAHGLYKGNDVSEASLAAIEAMALLKKYFPAAAPLLQGIDNSAVDIGILALRKSMLDALGAKTASQIGLLGGYNGYTDSEASGSGSIEIYPWIVKTDGSVDIDKDTEWSVQQEGNPATPAQIKLNRKLSQGYKAATLPQISDSIYKLKMVSKDTVALVTADSEVPVTYQMCADLLGFTSASMGAPASMTDSVQYKLVRNLDGQNHVHKGAFGVRLDEAEECSVSNVLISETEIEALPATRALGSNQVQVSFGVNHSSELESDVNRITGVSINSCEDVEIINIRIANCDAQSECYGVEIAGKSEKISVEKVSASSIRADEFATALRVAANTTGVKVKEISGESITVGKPDEIVGVVRSGPVLVIESESAKLN